MFDMLTGTSPGAYVMLVFGAAILLYFIAKKRTQSQGITSGSDGESPDQVVFLFQDESLIDATPSARSFLNIGADQRPDWHNIIAALSATFPDLPAKLQGLKKSGTFIIDGLRAHGGGYLRGELFNGITRLTYAPPEIEPDVLSVPSGNLAAIERELDTLRMVVNASNVASWVENSSGEICWANPAYLTLIQATQPVGSAAKWPPLNLFSPLSGPGSRTKITSKIDQSNHWFDVFREQHGQNTYCYATPIDCTIQAETDLKEFRETLTKTFATLSVGLAVFNRSRQLVMFNPSLMGLTSLNFESLSLKPTLYEFFDLLREARIVPERKDFSNWRQHISLLEDVANNGLYEETWSLPSGQTFRFTGHPQPDGAIALFLEDISAEVSATRNFHAELRLNQAVLDQLDHAVLVLSPSGEVSLSNNAYANLWGVSPTTSLCTLTFQDSFDVWQNASPNDPAWQDVKSAFGCGNAVGRDFDAFSIKGTPLTGGAYMFQFLPCKVTILEHSDSTVKKDCAAPKT